jgi:hypothetical protein
MVKVGWAHGKATIQQSKSRPADAGTGDVDVGGHIWSMHAKHSYLVKRRNIRVLGICSRTKKEMWQMLKQLLPALLP